MSDMISVDAVLILVLFILEILLARLGYLVQSQSREWFFLHQVRKWKMGIEYSNKDLYDKFSTSVLVELSYEKLWEETNY